MIRKWNDQNIKENLMEVAQILGINRMPSVSELRAIGRGDLCNIVCKTGGFKLWASKMGWELKTSDTQFGQAYEEYVATKLASLGHTCELTGTKHPYDIYVDDCVKIDVKASRITKIRGYEAFSFRLNKTIPTCDIYFLVGIKSDGTLKEYVVPSYKVKGNVQICISPEHSTYDKYLGRYDFVSAYADALKVV